MCMEIILLSGGSGKRLWPLSNDIRSKQFIKIIKNESGEYDSMVQRVYGQIKNTIPEANVTIATSKSQVSSILNQLGDKVGISVEPCRRDTFPAIALSAVYLADIKKISLDEPVIICPVDPLVNNEYFKSFRMLCEQVKKSEANIVLMGVEPTYPSEKYGYIIPEDDCCVSQVRYFKEKPNKNEAEHYINQGALWNSGVFAFKLRYMLEKIHSAVKFNDYNDLVDKYSELKKISFDYAVVENESKINVMRFKGQWKDIGTWNTLTEAMTENNLGKVIPNNTCENVHVLNELNIPVLAMGLKNVVIAASPEGILVSDKEYSAHIKPYVDNLDNQIMFADKSWGNYRVLSVEKNSMVVMITINQGHSMNYHSHEHRDEVWTVISGYGHVVLDGEMQNIKTGDIINMPIGCKHTVFADTELKLLEVQFGNDINAADKIKHDFEPDTRCFGNSDIRGIYPTQVNRELAYRIGRYFKKILVTGEKSNNEKFRIAVGNDIRLSGPLLKKSLIKGLCEAGCEVIDIGQCGTEMIYFSTVHLNLDGGIMITASHNPKSYNGFKFVRSGARPISRDSGLKELEYYCNSEPEPLQKVTSVNKGITKEYSIISEYIDHLLTYIDVEDMKRRVSTENRKLRIVVNAGNGAAGPILDILTTKLPFEFIKINNRPDGNFPNGVPNPLIRENRDETAHAVRTYGADMGIAWDGDFDRCFIFDEDGVMIESAYMVGFLAEAFLKKQPGASIIHDTRVYWNTQDVCKQFGGHSIICRSGHSFIKEKMRQVDAVYGGEMSAHHYFKDFAYCDSGMIPWLLVLELVQHNGKKLSDMLTERMNKFPCSGEINSKVDDKDCVDELMRTMEDKYSDGKIDHIDGLSVAYDNWRFNIRCSNTEPVVRLNVETKGDKCVLNEHIKKLLNIIRH